MTCILCRRTISSKAPRSYALVPNGRDGMRRVYACTRCNRDGRFDAWIDRQWAEEPQPFVTGKPESNGASRE